MMSSRRDGCSPIHVRTKTAHKTVEPVAFDRVRFIVVRAGSAILCSEFGTRQVNMGDVVVVAATTLCGAEPEGSVTTTTLYLDRDYLVDQVFWRYAGHITDRLHAKQILDSRYAGTAQILRLGEDRAGILMPWLDELAALSADGLLIERFYRVQSLVFAIMDVTAPHLKVTAHRATGIQREGKCLFCPRHCQHLALREEARRAAKLLRDELERRWTLRELAETLHLSVSQLDRVFVAGFGKPPIAYLAMLRAERMAHLLRATDMPVSTIARQVGWSDADFASRQFRRNVGVTPTRYRAMSQSDRRRAASG